nr:FHA domain-containing protein [Lysobacter sp. CAU 1642]
MIVVERLGRHGELLERQRHRLPAEGSLRIGRGWECEVHLDDPHVALHHASLRLGPDGSLALVDEGSLNGLIDAGTGRREARLEVQGERELRLGACRLRLIDGRLAQPAERPLDAGAVPSRLRWSEAFGWLLAALGSSLLIDWLGEVGEVRSSALLTGALVGGIIMLAWSFGWALITRLFAGEMRFLRHLRVVAIGSLLATTLMLVVQYGSYALALEPVTRFAYVGYWLLFAAVCWRHLKVMGRGHPRSKALAMLALAAAAIGLQSLSLWQPRDGAPQQARYVRSVVLPAVRLRPLQDVDGFLDRAAALEPELVDARSEDEESAESAAD